MTSCCCCICILLFFSPILIILILKLYCKLTLGRCHSREYMSGKTVLITGASAGIGKETALNLARRNARVLLACRNVEKAEKVKQEIISRTGNTNVVIKHLDLESMDSVRKCAEDVLKTEKRLDVLINNAGTASYKLEFTKDGHEKNMQVNFLGHFLFTLLLLDLLRKSKPSRIINVSSLVYAFAVLNFDDMKGTKQGFFLSNIGNFYYRSKLANIWFTSELARRLEGTGVTVNCLHPGLIDSGIFYIFDHPVIYIYRFFLRFLGKTAEEGAQTSVYLAVDPDLQNVTGKFFYDCSEHCLWGQAKNRTKARKLFEMSEKIVGRTFDES